MNEEEIATQQKKNKPNRIRKDKRKEKRFSESASTAAVAGGLLREELAGIDGGGAGLLVEGLQGDFGGVFFGIVDVLAIIPVASGDSIMALNGHGTGPGGSTSCIPDARTISIRCQARK